MPSGIIASSLAPPIPKNRNGGIKMGMQQSRAHEESQISEPFYGCGETNAAKRQAAGRRLLAPNELYFLRVCLRAFASSRLLFGRGFAIWMSETGDPVDATCPLLNPRPLAVGY
jgi:hypothetical protein